MRVSKIIQANPEVFNTNPYKNYSKEEAVELIASMKYHAFGIQKKVFKLRQTYIAVCNLLDLGYRETAVELGIEAIAEAAALHEFGIAQELSAKLTQHFLQIDDEENIKRHKALFEKFSRTVKHHHKSLDLCAQILRNAQKLESVDENEVHALINLMQQYLPYDSIWYHYFYYRCKTLVQAGEEIEKTYKEGIEYFENLHHTHNLPSALLREGLILHYLKHEKMRKAEQQLLNIEKGTIPWFRAHLPYSSHLLAQQDLKSNDVCLLIMNHPNYTNIPKALKQNWKKVYKESVQLLLKS